MGVSEEGFRAMTRIMLEIADRFAGSKIAFLLEGGYDLAALRNSVAAVLETLQQPLRLRESSEFQRAASTVAAKNSPSPRKVYQIVVNEPRSSVDPRVTLIYF